MTMKLPPYYFVFDVESIGLHGEGYAVGGGIFTPDGQEQSSFRFACDPAIAIGSIRDRKWVEANVPRIPITHHWLNGIREAFWQEWMKAREVGAMAAAECLWPVEASFFCASVAEDKSARTFEGPYPFLEISSVMLAAGMDPMATYERTGGESPAHDPLCDARQSARLLSEALLMLKAIH